MNIFLLNILVILFCLTIGYIFGSIPTSVLIGKYFFHQDPRDFGSHNTGGTNSARLWGKKVGIIITILDMVKAIIPLYICYVLLTYVPITKSGLALCPTSYGFLNSNTENYSITYPVYWLAILGAILGHCWPIFANFRGGKASSCFMGSIIGSSWLLGFVPATLYLILIKKTRIVSVASIFSSIFATILTWIMVILFKVFEINLNIFAYGFLLYPDMLYALVITLSTAVLILRHKDNISRLINGREPSIKSM